MGNRQKLPSNERRRFLRNVRNMLPSGCVLSRRQYEDGGWLVLPQRRRVHIHVRCYDGRRDPRFALVQRDGRVAARRFARAWVIVERRLEGMDMLADRAEMQVSGLSLGEVVVERRSRQRSENRRDRHKREHRANAPECFSIPHSASIIARRRLHHILFSIKGTISQMLFDRLIRHS